MNPKYILITVTAILSLVLCGNLYRNYSQAHSYSATLGAFQQESHMFEMTRNLVDSSESFKLLKDRFNAIPKPTTTFESSLYDIAQEMVLTANGVVIAKDMKDKADTPATKADYKQRINQFFSEFIMNRDRLKSQMYALNMISSETRYDSGVSQ